MRTKRYKIIIFMAVLIIAQSLFSESFDLVIMKTDGTVIRKATTEIDNITFSGDLTNMVVLAKDASSTSTPKADIESVVFQETGTVTDIDGNTYKTIKIGDQWWMAENLKTTKYKDGTPIPNITDATAWKELSAGAYCHYDNNVSYAETYGALYNWFAVNGDTDGNGTKDKEIAPEGWHVPTDAEWKELEMFLGMSQSTADIAGWRGTEIQSAKLRSTSGWDNDRNATDGNGTNEVGFAAFPGGERNNNSGYFAKRGFRTAFWTASESGDAAAWRRLIDIQEDGAIGVYRGTGSRNYGYSLRCVKDSD